MSVPKERALAEIARVILRLETLEERGRDHLDFKEQHIRTIASALEAAYLAGRASAEA